MTTYLWTDCHTPAWPLVPMHTDAEVDAAHITTTAGCESCHDPSLVTEHGKYPVNSEFKFQCTTCHTSTDPNVTAAIAGGDTDCYACHADPGHEALHDTTVPPSCEGSGCHAGTNLVPIHSTLDCAGCHSSTDPDVVGAIANGDKDCASCHPGGGHEALHETTVPVSCSGTGCAR